jgi:hypothetical protein
MNDTVGSNGTPHSRLNTELPRVHSAASLYHSEIQELQPLVDGLLYDGLTMLVAKPKDGKSWLALQLSIAIAGGKPIDGIAHRETGIVLFAALEEPAARTSNRLRKLAAPGPWLEQLRFVYDLLAMMRGGAEQLAELIRQHQPPARRRGHADGVGEGGQTRNRRIPRSI